MSDVINLGTRVSNLDVSPQFDTYSKVIIHIDDDTQVSAGNDSGRVMEVDNPLGTQALAEEMLAKLRGYRYQPYQADGALLDPAAEIGDAVDTLSAYGGIYTRNRTFGRLMRADISAPHDEEINHEYQFESPQERKYKREMGDARASLIIQSNMIKAEVEARKAQGEELSSQIVQTAESISASAVAKTGGTQVSFGWDMDATSHRWYANGQEVMRVSASGLLVKGEIQATTGKIGGFDIGANALTYNGLNWGDTSKNYGAYIGQSGIQLGKNFKVDNAGNVSAVNMKLTGTLTIGGSTITADALRQGAQQSYNNYGSWNSAYGWTSNNGNYCVGGANAGYKFDDMINNRYEATYLKGKYIYATQNLNTPILIVEDYRATWKTATINGTTIRYLGR